MRRLLYFGASNCPPCRFFWQNYVKPRIADVYTEQVDFVVDSYGVAKRYNITKTPTMVLLEDEKEVRRFIGCSERYIDEIISFLENE